MCGAPRSVLEKWLEVELSVHSLYVVHNVPEFSDVEEKELGFWFANRAPDHEPVQWVLDVLSNRCCASPRIKPSLQLNISCLHKLCELSIDRCPAWTTFTAGPLKKLTALTRLSVRGCHDYSLDELPGSVRDLTLGYGEIWERDVLSSHGISIPVLPARLSLEFLRLEKQGAIGLPMDLLWNSCVNIEVEAMFVLSAVGFAQRGEFVLGGAYHQCGAAVA